ncbi:DUF6197 family protein [Streptomyces violascens]|uniref:DUF6197 family protein n=1 Tax=Streptomyces violascens TaxID=67381 RepID=UPI00167636C1|nr:hypothetical protein [Streptomyces violascens]GGU49801.1 hypothetical protein GCM10010289_82840 [Streptomyces violascens]
MAATNTSGQTGRRLPAAAPAPAVHAVPVVIGGRRRVLAVPPPPGRGRTLLPRSVRTALSNWGLVYDSVAQPLIPSAHLIQLTHLLQAWGWGQSFDISPSGRLCIRGGQTVLEHHGYVTPAGRARAVEYMRATLAEAGVSMEFYAWNDLSGRTFGDVETLLNRSAAAALSNKE